MSINDELQEPLLERLSSSPDPEQSSRKLSKKRKRISGKDQPSKKIAKITKKARPIEDDDLDTESSINKAFSHMDNQLLADYIAQRTREYESDLSSIELEDKYLPGR
jgi:protein CMS1